ncbi:endolytic transglycosylase MltG [Curvibacter sp. HBC61]|uniref:Endolytic murein transglycosylase n=1 Tax=Curvibacter cyanobacteriorum TaxID=3026422 RepID=A0ABT5MU11_9BURK|nr:endolytic transglycosylase MltG [Curvibacter sp. HBC61]MDD0837525.1 endolytic transglycosylase MltG [Curvibacter sp. HBC61]
MLVVLILAAAALGGAVFWWLDAPLRLSAPTLDLSIEPGTSPRALAQDVQDAGVDVNPYFLYAWFRFSGQARGIKAGSYELDASLTPRSLLNKLVRGEEALRAVTLVEGWNWRQVRAALARADQLRGDTRDLSDESIMRLLERPGVPPEGRFFPDTYTYSKGSSDVAVLRRALRAMDKKLAAAWDARADQLPLKSPEEVLTLASIIEKETGRGSDRPLIASVFINRLRSGMLLQTDPTVIYGLGERFDGNLRKRDLLTDTPWNTYTRPGLPPTPIAMPGRAALLAAVQPANTPALYFVARGDGSSQFSRTLDEHNRAVNQYQRRP